MVVLNVAVTVSLILFYGYTFVSGSTGKKDNEIFNENFTDENNSLWYRLPNYVIPKNYELWLFPQLAVNNFTYEGHVKIELDIFNETESLIVHVVGLEIDQDESKVTAIINETDVDLPIVKQEFDSEKQIYIVSLETNLQPGRYILSLSFAGEVLGDLFGFYRSSYESGGKTRWLGVTQFSSIFARRAFPCLDEPYLKAPYQLHIGHYQNETVTGNTLPEKIQEIKPGYFLTTFAKTPPMSTYLVGWAIHDFKYTESSNSTRFGIWTRETMKIHSSQVLTDCMKIYAALNNWIGVENPIHKMEQVAVPDFHYSAMENWGMVTFRESVVLWEDGVTPTLTIHNGLNTIAHEYAHTWFGNLVTPKFWNVAWLKEGFATFFGHYGVSIVHSDRRIMDLFGVEVLQEALLQDSAQHNRTMNGEGFGRAKNIPGSMDFVTYKKAASIIRMVYHLIGDWAFHRGLQSYVQTLANYHAVPNDFYEHLQHFADQETLLEKPIQLKNVVESWANQPGYPVITVTINDSTRLEMTQEKFWLNRTGQKDDVDDSGWWIPINFGTVESGTNDVPKTAMIWMRPKDKIISTTINQQNGTIICNVHQAYYYRVNYDLTNWQRLTNHLKSADFKTVGSTSRAALIDDSFNLAKGGYIDYSIPLELSRYLSQEIDYEPWVAAATSFNFLDAMLNGLPDLKRDFQIHVNRLVQPIYENLTFHENSSDEWRTKLLRNLIMSTACSMNNIDCSNVANSLFKEWLTSPGKKINPDVKRSVYCTGIHSSGQKEWHEVLEIFLKTELHTEQELLIYALGCTNNSTLVGEFLNYLIYDGPEIRKQYRLTILDAVLKGNPENVEHALNFVDKNLEMIVAKRDEIFLIKIYEAIGKRIVLDQQLQKLISLIENNDELLDSSLEDARKAIEFAEKNISWIRTYAPSIARWLKGN